MIRVERKPQIRGDAFNLEEDWLIVATEEDADTLDRVQAIQLVIDETEDVVDDLFRGNCAIQEWHEGKGITIAVVNNTYGDISGDGGGSILPETDATYEFRYQAPSGHIYWSLESVSHTTYLGSLGARRFGGRIKVNSDLECEGIDLPSGNTTNIWRINTNKQFIAPAYEVLVENMMGAVNSVPFKGRPAGSMRFVACDMSITAGNKVQLTWGFQYEANQTNILVRRIDTPDITVPSKKGHHLIWQWDEFKKIPADLAAIPPRPVEFVPQAHTVIVERIFKELDLNQLGF